MGIQSDAGKIFDLMYKLYRKKDRINAESILETTKMNGNDIDTAIKYLRDLRLIEVIFTMGNYNGIQNFIFRKITPFGINIAENEKEFYDTFNVDKKTIKWDFENE